MSGYNNSEEAPILGAYANIKFAALGNKELKSKVDTGATTSSLHAENIKIDREHNRVSFTCPEISTNVITVDLAGAQEVHAAGQAGEQRPIIALDVDIDGKPLERVEFNLNDRSNMDVPVLLGQNAIKAGNFKIDINDENPTVENEIFPSIPLVPGDMSREDKIKMAVNVLVANNVLVSELIKYYLPNAVAAMSQDTEVVPSGE